MTTGPTDPGDLDNMTKRGYTADDYEIKKGTFLIVPGSLVDHYQEMTENPEGLTLEDLTYRARWILHGQKMEVGYTPYIHDGYIIVDKKNDLCIDVLNVANLEEAQKELLVFLSELNS